MEMHQIRYFLAVCEKSNFTQAAQLTYVSQPSLTQAIKKLEQELGGELFVRNRSGCELTALGRLVEPNLRHMHQEALSTKAKAIPLYPTQKISTANRTHDHHWRPTPEPFFCTLPARLSEHGTGINHRQ